MKTQLSKPSRTKARYTEEYKQGCEIWEIWNLGSEFGIWGQWNLEFGKFGLKIWENLGSELTIDSPRFRKLTCVDYKL